jgi:hypothetical protein
LRRSRFNALKKQSLCHPIRSGIGRAIPLPLEK